MVSGGCTRVSTDDRFENYARNLQGGETSWCVAVAFSACEETACARGFLLVAFYSSDSFAVGWLVRWGYFGVLCRYDWYDMILLQIPK